MMGRRERGQDQFFYEFDLDKVVPAYHLVRQIDGVPSSVTLSSISPVTRPILEPLKRPENVAVMGEPQEKMAGMPGFDEFDEPQFDQVRMQHHLAGRIGLHSACLWGDGG